MHIAMTAESHLRIIQVQYLEARETDHCIEVPQHLPCCSSARNIVTGPPEMGRIEADAQAFAIPRQSIQHSPQLLEAVAKRVTGTNIIFQQQDHLWRRLRQDAFKRLD